MTGNLDNLPNMYIENTAAHEMGHWYDRFILGSVTAPFSGKSLFKDEQGAAKTATLGDYPVFNGLGAPCDGFNHPFGGQQDIRNPVNYICAANGAGPGLNPSAPPPTSVGGPYTKFKKKKNTAILAEAVGTNYSDPAELFANEVAFNAGTSFSYPEEDHYMEDFFTCTQTVVLSELQYGVPPGPGQHYQLPPTCPAN